MVIIVDGVLLIIVDGVLLAAGWGMCWLWSKKHTSKATPHDGAEPFQDLSNTICPKCNISWDKRTNVKYCVCAEYHEDHFHLECGICASHQKQCGCGYKWIMKVAK
jgi:hypothetical protein